MRSCPICKALLGALHIRARKNGLEAAEKAASHDILSLGSTGSGVREIYVIITWHAEGNKGSNHKGVRAQIVPKTHAGILEVAVIVPVVSVRAIQVLRPETPSAATPNRPCLDKLLKRASRWQPPGCNAHR